MFTITIYRDSSAYILSRLFVTFTKWCRVFCLLSCFVHYVIVAASVELITRQPCCLLYAINYVVMQVHFYLFNVFVIWMVLLVLLVLLVMLLVLVLVMMLPDIFVVHSSRFTTCIEHAMGSHVQTHAVHIFKQCTAPPRKKHILNNRQFFHLNCYHIDRIFLFFLAYYRSIKFSFRSNLWRYFYCSFSVAACFSGSFDSLLSNIHCFWWKTLFSIDTLVIGCIKNIFVNFKNWSTFERFHTTHNHFLLVFDFCSYITHCCHC